MNFVFFGENRKEIGYGLAADRQEYCFTKDYIFYFIFILFYFRGGMEQPYPL